MKKLKKNMPSVFILGIGSDIGVALAEHYLNSGCSVAGTYRSKSSVRKLLKIPQIRLFKCDFTSKSSIEKCVNKYKYSSFGKWDIFISCVGVMEPIGKFFNTDFDSWERSVIVNSTAQLRFLHNIHSLRRKGKISSVVFFAGGGTNNPFTNYSAYCVSKIMLIKMCELLDDENRDLNVFIIGPGWVRTKIHAQTLKNYSSAGGNYKSTKEFLKSGKPGTDYRDIYDCINWCVKQEVVVSGGRNFSVVHDPWEKNCASLVSQLRADTNKFKLRRFGNKS